GMRSLRSAFRNGSWRECPLLIRVLLLIRSSSVSSLSRRLVPPRSILHSPFKRGVALQKFQDFIVQTCIGGVEPCQVLFPAQPGQLALPELLRRNNRFSSHFRPVEFPGEVRPGLAIAHETHGREP